MGKLDIEIMVRSVCEAVLGDKPYVPSDSSNTDHLLLGPNASKHVKQARCNALKAIGEVFESVGKEVERKERMTFQKLLQQEQQRQRQQR